VCSCFCDGPDPNDDYCECPTGMECAPMAEWVGLPGGYGDVTGSFCIPKGTRYERNDPPDTAVCDKELMNCGNARPY